MSVQKLESKSEQIMDVLEKHFLNSSGTHLLVDGITGSGKTQTLYWLFKGFIERTNEVLLWYDIGKSGEFVKLAEISNKTMKIFVPVGCNIEIEGFEDYEVVEVRPDPIHIVEDLWHALDRDKINILSFQPFIIDPTAFTRFIADSFRTLIIEAHNYRIATPLTIFFDEFHNVAPSKDNALSMQHYNAGALVQYNIEKLRSLKIRIIASTHGDTKIRKGVRDCFSWRIIKRSSGFSGDQPKLRKFNKLWQGLRKDQSVIVFPDNFFSDIVHLPYYGEPSFRVKYKGLLEEVEK